MKYVPFVLKEEEKKASKKINGSHLCFVEVELYKPPFVTLFRFITVFRGTDNIPHNIPHIQTIMNMNNVMFGVSKVIPIPNTVTFN